MLDAAGRAAGPETGAFREEGALVPAPTLSEARPRGHPRTCGHEGHPERLLSCGGDSRNSMPRKKRDRAGKATAGYARFHLGGLPWGSFPLRGLHSKLPKSALSGAKHRCPNLHAVDGLILHSQMPAWPPVLVTHGGTFGFCFPSVSHLQSAPAWSDSEPRRPLVSSQDPETPRACILSYTTHACLGNTQTHRPHACLLRETHNPT